MITRAADPAWANFLAEGAKLGVLAAKENKPLKTVPSSPIQAPGQPLCKPCPAGAEHRPPHL